MDAMDDAVEAVESGGFYLGLALTHVPMMIFIGYGVLTIVERAMGSRRGKIRTRLPTASELPFVCLQLPMYNEPACARRAIDAACAVRWPRNLIEVQVIDESNDGTEEVVDAACADWRERGVVCAAIRPSKVLRGKARQTKAAALEYARTRTSADFIVVVDADAMLEEDYLEKIIPYFYDDEAERRSEVAVVQPALSFRNATQNFLTMHQAFKMEADSIVGNRAYIRAFGCVLKTGSGAIWSAAALRAVGGWDQSLLALEGTDMSIRTRMSGYTGKAAANVVVETELPSTLSAYKSQQLRWMWTWAHLMKRHLIEVMFNSYNGISGKMKIGILNGNFARMWFAASLLRPAQWLLLTVWLLVLPELIVDGIWLGNAHHLVHGAVWLYFLPVLLILKGDTFAVTDVDSALSSPPKSTGEAVSTARSTLRKLSWIIPHMCFSLGMIAVNCVGYLRGIIGLTFPPRDAPVSHLRTPKIGFGDVELSDVDRGAEQSCSKGEIWQMVFEMGFVMAGVRASAELMRWEPTGSTGVGTMSLISVVGLVISACCLYVAAGSWDDKCGPRTKEHYYRRSKAANAGERAGLLSRENGGKMQGSTSSTKLRGSNLDAVETRSMSESDFTVGDDDDATRGLSLNNDRDISKAIRKYKKMRDKDFDIENLSEYAQSDMTSVHSDSRAPSHVNFGSVQLSHEDLASEFGSMYDIDVNEDDRSVDLDGKDRAALRRAKQNEKDSYSRAKQLRSANLRVNIAPSVPQSWSGRPPKSPSSRPHSHESSPVARMSQGGSPTAAIQTFLPPKPANRVVATSEWVDAPIVEEN